MKQANRRAGAVVWIQATAGLHPHKALRLRGAARLFEHLHLGFIAGHERCIEQAIAHQIDERLHGVARLHGAARQCVAGNSTITDSIQMRGCAIQRHAVDILGAVGRCCLGGCHSGGAQRCQLLGFVEEQILPIGAARLRLGGEQPAQRDRQALFEWIALGARQTQFAGERIALRVQGLMRFIELRQLLAQRCGLITVCAVRCDRHRLI
jgi:hypothetical protein